MTISSLREIIRRIILLELHDKPEEDIPVLVHCSPKVSKEDLTNAIFSSTLGTLRFTNQVRDNKILARLIQGERDLGDKDTIERVLSQEISDDLGGESITVKVLDHLD